MSETIFDEEFINIDYAKQQLSAEEFESCSFINCNFSQSDLTHKIFIDCLFDNCNFDRTKITDSSLRDVTFVDCKLSGIDFMQCNPFLFSANFENSKLSYVIFIEMKMENTQFDNCRINGSDFSGTDLTEASFTECDLTDTIFNRTVLDKADFSSAINFSIDPELNSMKKTVFSQLGLAGLLEKHDIIIE